jgi:hypothetical protein
MANRRDFYFRQKVTEAELDAAFNEMEVADRALASDLGLVGVAYGLTVSELGVPNLTVTVSGPGAAYDQTGQRIAIPSTQTVNCAVDEGGLNTAVVAPGNSRILSIFAEFDRTLTDPRVDGNSATVYFNRAESFQLNVVAGAEAAVPTAPALRADQILLADITLAFGAASITNANISTTRRQWMFKTTTGTAVAVGTAEEAIQVLADAISAASSGASAALAAHLADTDDAHDASAISYAGGSAWLDGDTNPATTVEAQLDKIINDLVDVGGAARIGAEGFDAGAFAVADGTVRSLIQDLAFDVSNMFATLNWRLDHTHFWGSGWSVGGVSGNELISSANLANLRIAAVNLPAGARIDAITVRIDPGGTRVGAARTTMGLFSINRLSGAVTTVQALTAEPNGNGNADHLWSLALDSPQIVGSGEMYYVSINAGDDGGAHNADNIKSVYLNLTYP